ncbi:putative UPF0481 protein [Cocos nucifera]|uniref:Putative UPF0481 protein n=1 Tax=Cocos nucifera TaxID=13894 RepID=A0A8K0HWM1_COCNU|nr:putative UPF0481 protein [Cocos nucifera]
MLQMYARKKEETEEEEIEEEEEVGKVEDETTKEDEGKKRRERTIETREAEVVLDIREEEKQLECPTVAGICTLGLVVDDLLKLENQIPFFIIKFLFDRLKPCEDEKTGLVDLALQLFKHVHPAESRSFEKKRKRSPREYHHLLHLFYSSRIPSEKPPSLEEADPSQEASAFAPKWTPKATELERAGVKFTRKESADSFLTITFEWRKTKIAPLRCLLNLWSGRMDCKSMTIPVLSSETS